MDYYNDNNEFCCSWLKRFVRFGRFGPAVIEHCDISAIKTDLSGFTQCHFFAGIGGWKIALDLAGWPANTPVWTGSCPCQPFSQAGKQKGVKDERHLWPRWFKLISQHLPPVIFGEQVASPLGRAWLFNVLTDLETLGYRAAAADLCAAGVGAPHIRQRVWFVADRLDNPVAQRLERYTKHEHCRFEPKWNSEKAYRSVTEAGVPSHRLVQPNSNRRKKRSKATTSMGHGDTVDTTSWSDIEWIPCADGKARPIKSGLCSVAHGIPNLAPKIAGYGNAIVPQVAAIFVQAYMDTLGG